jgi:hypothetical protein
VTDVKRMDVKEFREFGYLHEINRLLLHPLGLALEVVIEEDGSERLGGIWDYRDDPEGICYDPNLVSAEKAKRVSDAGDERIKARINALGYWIQPVK